MDRQHVLPSLFAGLLVLVSVTVFAQADPAMERMENELCGCMNAVDVTARDGAFQGSVKHCLEDAVVHHPAAMNTLLKDASGTGPKGVQLGELLGQRLDRRCTAFRAIRERLRRLNQQGALLKSAS